MRQGASSRRWGLLDRKEVQIRALRSAATEEWPNVTHADELPGR
jgi:hypothetical protein